MARTIMVGVGKGGVGKTTSVVNLGFELSSSGKSVLILDFDGQADTTKFLKRTNTEYFVGDLLLDRHFDINKVIYPAIINGQEQGNLHIIPGRKDDAMTKLDMDLFPLPKREERLNMHLSKIKDQYDFILIDTNPGTSVLGLNAVFAADEFIFPTEFKEHSLDGVDSLIKHIEDTTFIDESEIKFLVVPCKIAKAAKKSLAYGTEYLAGRFPNNTAKTTIWYREVFGDAELDHEPVSVFSKGHQAAMFYKNLAKEVIDNV